MKSGAVTEEFDHAADGYDLLVGANPGYHRHLRMSARRLALPDGGRGLRVLDLGCGTGASTAALVRVLPNAQIIGVDASAGMLDVARAKKWPPNVRFVHARAEELDPDDLGGPAHAILAAYLVRNCPDPDVALRAIAGLVRPGGRIILHEYSVADSAMAKAVWTLVCWSIVIPLGAAVTGRADLYRYLWRSVLEFDGAAALRGRLRAAGLENVKTVPMTGWQRGIVHSFLGRRPALATTGRHRRRSGRTDARRPVGGGAETTSTGRETPNTPILDADLPDLSAEHGGAVDGDRPNPTEQDAHPAEMRRNDNGVGPDGADDRDSVPSATSKRPGSSGTTADDHGIRAGATQGGPGPGRTPTEGTGHATNGADARSLDGTEPTYGSDAADRPAAPALKYRRRTGGVEAAVPGAEREGAVRVDPVDQGEQSTNGRSDNAGAESGGSTDGNAANGAGPATAAPSSGGTEPNDGSEDRPFTSALRYRRRTGGADAALPKAEHGGRADQSERSANARSDDKGTTAGDHRGQGGSTQSHRGPGRAPAKGSSLAAGEADARTPGNTEQSDGSNRAVPQGPLASDDRPAAPALNKRRRTSGIEATAPRAEREGAVLGDRADQGERPANARSDDKGTATDDHRGRAGSTQGGPGSGRAPAKGNGLVTNEAAARSVSDTEQGDGSNGEVPQGSPSSEDGPVTPALRYRRRNSGADTAIPGAENGDATRGVRAVRPDGTPPSSPAGSTKGGVPDDRDVRAGAVSGVGLAQSAGLVADEPSAPGAPGAPGAPMSDGIGLAGGSGAEDQAAVPVLRYRRRTGSRPVGGTR